jgi:hypothetical protein
MLPYVNRRRVTAIAGGEPAIKNATGLTIEGCAPAIAVTGHAMTTAARSGKAVKRSIKISKLYELPT